MIDSFDSNSFPNSDRLSEDSILEILELQASEMEEVVACQEAAAALAYSVPDAPINPQLKSRLFETLGLQPPSSDIYALLKLSIHALKAKAETLRWEPIVLAPGFEAAILQEEIESRTVACFIRADNPGTFPNHNHSADEVIVVLDGDLVDANQRYTAGDRLQSTAGSSHLLHTTQGCLLFVITSMDNQFD